MHKIHIIGNPNSGKTTLFNSITKSCQHVGNWHGVTVDKVSKIIGFDNTANKKRGVKDNGQSDFKQMLEGEYCDAGSGGGDGFYEIIDLPGLYSLNAFSYEEQVSVDEILSSECSSALFLMDANNFKRSMLLAIELLLNGKNIKILINNYTSFEKRVGGIDIQYLQTILGCSVEFINAKKVSVDEKFFKFTTRQTAFLKTLKNQLDLVRTESGNDADVECKKIKLIYKYILKISERNMAAQKIYGYNKFDRKFLKLGIILPAFILSMFFIVYITFFLLGPILSGWFIAVLHLVAKKPIMAILNFATKSKLVLAMFEEGVFGAAFSVLGFLPQICLMYLFLSALENSGIISRLAFVFDDCLQKVGLNGKIVYTMLMGFGCSTSASLTAKNMSDRNSKIKASLLTPFMSCSAKLPIYTTVALALCGVNGVWIIFGLYVLGIVAALVLALIFDRTILPSKSPAFIMEFPPLKVPDINAVWISIKSSCKHFVAKVCSLIFALSILLWLLSNFNIRLQYVGNSAQSILYSFSMIISWMFKPIGLGNPNIICALLIGLVAKELVLSSFAISNHVGNLALLGASLTLSSSPVCFNVATGISFLIFTLLYFPCVSNFGLLIKEIGMKYTLIGSATQLAIAYLSSYLIYTLLSKGFAHLLVAVVVITLIVTSIIFALKNIKAKKCCSGCGDCNKCK